MNLQCKKKSALQMSWAAGLMSLAFASSCSHSAISMDASYAAGSSGTLDSTTASSLASSKPISDNTDVLTPASALSQLSPGWNLGNTLEAIGSGAAPFSSSQETAWGNPAATGALMTAVKAAGFKSVRIPVSWTEYADGSNRIDPFWMRRVTEVVNAARSAGLYVIINVHWDGGWMQPTPAAQTAVDAKLTRFWTQIATNFKDQDDHLLFAGTNEIMVTNVYSAPTQANCAVQNGFNQTFVDAVRATGGSNATRFLVVQGYNTNIDYTVSCNAKLPLDTVAHRLMVEVHYYDPYDFTLNTSNSIWQWGAKATDQAATETWANEAYADAQFQKMKINFIDKGVPVILGEYAASLRTEHDADGTYRTLWDQYITRSAHQHGLVPMYWDNGPTSNHSSGLFNRAAATEAFPETIEAIVKAGS